MYPSVYPSNGPSTSNDAPTAAPTITCEDDPMFIFDNLSGRDKNCAAAAEKPKLCLFTAVSEHCPKACSICGAVVTTLAPTLAPTVTAPTVKPSYVPSTYPTNYPSNEPSIRSSSQGKGKSIKGKGAKGKNHSPSPAPSSDNCQDDADFRFKISDGRTKTCAWLAVKSRRQSLYCDERVGVENKWKTQVKFFCRMACKQYLRRPCSDDGSLSDEPSSSPSFYAKGKGKGS